MSYCKVKHRVAYHREAYCFPSCHALAVEIPEERRLIERLTLVNPGRILTRLVLTRRFAGLTIHNADEEDSFQITLPVIPTVEGPFPRMDGVEATPDQT